MLKKSKIAVYPGTFDPVTNGHVDLIKRAARIFEKVIVAVASEPSKLVLFSSEERAGMVREAIRTVHNVRVEEFDGLVVDYVRKAGANVVIRGLRMLSDFEYEFQMALTNRKLAPGIETIFMMPHESYSYISSKLIKETAALGANLKDFVPRNVRMKLKEKLIENRGTSQ